jgi:hypothetical protein
MTALGRAIGGIALGSLQGFFLITAIGLAGAIARRIAAILKLPLTSSITPILGLACWLLMFLLYFGIPAVAIKFTVAPREIGRARVIGQAVGLGYALFVAPESRFNRWLESIGVKSGSSRDRTDS